MEVFIATILGGVAGLEKNLINDRTLKAKREARDAESAWGRPATGVAFDRRTGLWSYTKDADRVLGAMRAVLAGNSNLTALCRLYGQGDFLLFRTGADNYGHNLESSRR